MVPVGPLHCGSQRVGFRDSVFIFPNLRLRLQWRTRLGTRCTSPITRRMTKARTRARYSSQLLRLLALCSTAPAFQRVQSGVHGPSKRWLLYDPGSTYRVRAPNARSHRSPAPPLQAHFKSEAIEPHTIVIIIRFFGGVFYRVMRLLLPIQFIYIVWRFGRCGLCECGQLEEALQALGDYAHPHHDAQTSV